MADPPLDGHGDHNITQDLTIDRMTVVASAVLNQEQGTTEEKDTVVTFLRYLFHPRLASEVERSIQLVITIDRPAGVPPGGEVIFRAYQIITLRPWLSRVGNICSRLWLADKYDGLTTIIHGSEPGGPPGSYPDEWFEEALAWRTSLGVNIVRTALDDCTTLWLYKAKPLLTTRLEYQREHDARVQALLIGLLGQCLVSSFGRGVIGPIAILREQLSGVKLELLRAVLRVLAAQPGVMDKFRQYESGIAATE